MNKVRHNMKVLEHHILLPFEIEGDWKLIKVICCSKPFKNNDCYTMMSIDIYLTDDGWYVRTPEVKTFRTSYGENLVKIDEKLLTKYVHPVSKKLTEQEMKDISEMNWKSSGNG